MKTIIILLGLGMGTILPSCSSSKDDKSNSEIRTMNIEQATDTLSHHLVCMVNDTYMEKDQIPVDFAGKTYYGCCEMCVSRIQNDRTIRNATDPVTGNEVSKADAVIGLAPGGQGKVLYFESMESYKKYKIK